MTWELRINNIAGIIDGRATIEEGVNAVRASNWQGKSSLLTAIQTAMGTKTVLREGADRGSIELITDEEEHVVSLVRDKTGVKRENEPYLTDEQVRISANLFAFLDENNGIRRAVRNGQNLEELLTRPLDFENIDEQIETLRRERDQIDSSLEQANAASAKLPNVERTITQLEDELESLRTRRTELAEKSANTSDKQDELRSAIAERKQTEQEITRLERSVERTEETLADHRSTLADLDRPDVDNDLEQRISEVKSELTEAKRDADLLQSIYAPTKRILEEDRLELLTDVDSGLLEDTVSCWTCDEDTTKDQIESQIDWLGERVTEYQQTADEYQQELDRLKTRRSEYESSKRRQKSLEREISDLKSTLEDREGSLRQTRSRLEELEERIDDLSATVESEDEQLTDLDGEIKYTEQRLEEQRTEREELEARAEEQAGLEQQREEISEEITALRTRKEKMKRRIRESFESAMQQIIDRLGTGFESARLTPNFDIIVAREGREADLNTLSDGEVELLGVFAALAGYEAFELTDKAPVILVDDLGGLADENVKQVIEYLDDRATYLVFTAYPEHSSIESNTIDPSEWDVVSPKPT